MSVVRQVVIKSGIVQDVISKYWLALSSQYTSSQDSKEAGANRVKFISPMSVLAGRIGGADKLCIEIYSCDEGFLNEAKLDASTLSAKNPSGLLELASCQSAGNGIPTILPSQSDITNSS